MKKHQHSLSAKVGNFECSYSFDKLEELSTEVLSPPPKINSKN